ncbi:MAG: hypothetical protein Kow0098_01410 [Ignavibacteriaceae bacterium]
MKSAIYLLVFTFIFSFTFFSCNKEEATTEPPAPVCDQACQDEHVAFAVVDMFWFIWNQNIAGQQVGTKDFTVDGPQGGTVHVTGTTDYSTNNINTLHLVLEMNNCKGVDEKYNLTFNCTITADGTFSLLHKAITYSSGDFQFSGTVGKDDWITNVSGNCSISINETLTSVAGTICGRTFSY